jgi:hypothetical protein
MLGLKKQKLKNKNELNSNELVEKKIEKLENNSEDDDKSDATSTKTIGEVIDELNYNKVKFYDENIEIMKVLEKMKGEIDLLEKCKRIDDLVEKIELLIYDCSCETQRD